MTINNVNKPVLSIALSTCNVRELLPIVLPALVENTDVIYELHIVDNASKDGTAEYIKDFFDTNKSDYMINYTLEVMPEREASLIALNKCLAKVSPVVKYVCKLDHDLEVPPKWASTIIDFFEKNPQFRLIASGVEKGFDKGFQCWRDGHLGISDLGEHVVWHQQGIAGYMHFFPKHVLDACGGHYNSMNKTIFGSEDADWSLRASPDNRTKGYLMNVVSKHHWKKNKAIADLEDRWKGECTFNKTNLQWEDWLKSQGQEVRYT